MTKKDFEMVAGVMLYARPDESAKRAFERWQMTCQEFARQFAGMNPRFDKARFLKACGY